VNINNVFNLNYLAYAIQTTDATAGNPRDASFELVYSF
jgi:outer membrane receptor for ferric coprogen and ferric-rhodotorulic acid